VGRSVAVADVLNVHLDCIRAVSIERTMDERGQIGRDVADEAVAASP